MLGGLLVVAGFAARAISGVLVLVLVARLLGPQAFGVFSFGLAVASLWTAVINFGLGSFALRASAERPDLGASILGDVLLLRMMLGGVVVLLGSIEILLFRHDEAGIAFALLLALTGEAIADTHLIRLRVLRRYPAEAGIEVAVSLIHLVVVVGVTLASPTAHSAAFAFGASRLLGLSLLQGVCRRLCGPLPRPDPRSALRTLRASFAYAIEYVALTAASQLDAVVIRLMAGAAALGIYQAGVKIVQGLLRIGPVIAIYLLPSLTSRMVAGELRIRQAAAVPMGFALLGLVVSLPLLLFPRWIVDALYGASYEPLVALLPWFAALLLLKLTEVAAGVVVVAVGAQSAKTSLVLVQVLTSTIAGLWAVFVWGPQGWLGAAIAGQVFLLTGYAVLVLRRISPGRRSLPA
ncbi:MAG TPA: oligosaccharide flippase family protein [Burkholderiaceae bacterium]|nr:oligosaccharide flippase family protein [Burkholderiaceae bacterium]